MPGVVKVGKQLSERKTRRPSERPAMKRLRVAEKERERTAGVLLGWIAWRVFMTRQDGRKFEVL